MSDIRSILISLTKPLCMSVQETASIVESKAKRGDTVKTKNDFAAVTKVFDDEDYMIKFEGVGSTRGFEVDGIVPIK